VSGGSNAVWSSLVPTSRNGRFFHPLLATLITGAARLMLAIAERLVAEAQLEWTFCDTDSMAIAKTVDTTQAEFHSKVDKIVGWFSKLNPYDFGGSILKVEDVNFRVSDPKQREPLYCWAVSAKRYALFNITSDGRPILRKASAHGLGHLRAPYDETNPAVGIPRPIVALNKIGVELWQHDLWWKITSAALSGKPDQIDLSYHPGLNQPAISRYAATTPKLLRWFSSFNKSRSYENQVKPFGFMYSLHAGGITNEQEEILTLEPQRTRWRPPTSFKPVAPYDSKITEAIRHCFDRGTGVPVDLGALKSFKQAIGSYHLHPESKFLNGDYLDKGVTLRRHVYAAAVRNIGKEANEWEEQFYLGFNEDKQIDYGLASKALKKFIRTLRARIQKAGGQRTLARESGVSRRTISRIMNGKQIRSSIFARIRRALTKGGSS
jgi:hypothetical protein